MTPLELSPVLNTRLGDTGYTDLVINPLFWFTPND
jgi:hypothetical protein